jgi:hypothetical protein
MTVYVLGAGASKHAGYPLASEMGVRLFEWMKEQVGSERNYPAVADLLEQAFGQCDEIEDLLTRAQQLIDEAPRLAESLNKRFGPCKGIKDGVAQVQQLCREYETGLQDQGVLRSLVEQQLGKLPDAVRDWFSEIRSKHVAEAYAQFATNRVQPGDCILTFNYDASVERSLNAAGKWRVGDGYGFDANGFPRGSVVKVLKLHGSVGWLALASGLPAPGSSKAVSLVFADTRPAIPSSELAFLGYSSVSDPLFASASPAAPLLIMPARKKEFVLETGGESEWGWFWDGLWSKAADALRQADRIAICGYSMLPVDERAHNMLLEAPSKNAEIVVVSGEKRGKEIVEEYQSRGYKLAETAEAFHFEDWVGSSINP